MQTETKTATSVAVQPLPARKQTSVTEQPSSAKEQTPVHLPLGLLGFEQFKKFQLIRDAAEAPFEWLLSVDDPSLGFLVLSPFIVVPSYQPDIDPQDAEFLQLGSSDDALVLSTVTLQSNGVATLNLKGPIMFNRHTLVGKQVVPRNAAEYSTRHPLAQAMLAYDHVSAHPQNQ
jgi:flagellar assembly factor FliW